MDGASERIGVSQGNNNSAAQLSAHNTSTAVVTAAATNPAGRAKIKYHDHYISLAPIGRIMSQYVPTNARISDEAREAVQECVSEYISYIMGEAQSICMSKKRAILNGEDVLWALKHLGFDDYIGPLTVYLQKYRISEGDNRMVDGPPIKPIVIPPTEANAQLLQQATAAAAMTMAAVPSYSGLIHTRPIKVFRDSVMECYGPGVFQGDMDLGRVLLL